MLHTVTRLWLSSYCLSRSWSLETLVIFQQDKTPVHQTCETITCSLLAWQTSTLILLDILNSPDLIDRNLGRNVADSLPDKLRHCACARQRHFHIVRFQNTYAYTNVLLPILWTLKADCCYCVKCVRNSLNIIFRISQGSDKFEAWRKYYKCCLARWLLILP